VIVAHFFGLALCAQTAAVSSPLMATVSLPSNTVKMGQPVIAFVTLKNTSQRLVTIVLTNPLRDFQIAVVDSKGVPVERTPYGKSMLHPPDVILRNFRKPLLPGESVREALELSLAFILTTPGVYSLSVSRIVADVNDGTKKFVATAPMVSFSIEP
jgi:hypothetical protein